MEPENRMDMTAAEKLGLQPAAVPPSNLPFKAAAERAYGELKLPKYQIRKLRTNFPGTKFVKLTDEWLQYKSDSAPRDHITRSGKTINFFVQGNTEDAVEDYPILCIHGTNESKYYWTLRDHGQDGIPGVLMYAVDRPGYGESLKTGKCSIADEVSILWEFVDQMIAPKFPKTKGSVIIMGHGAGAAIALNMAASKPMQCTGLILWGAPFDEQQAANLASVRSVNSTASTAGVPAGAAAGGGAFALCGPNGKGAPTQSKGGPGNVAPTGMGREKIGPMTYPGGHYALDHDLKGMLGNDGEYSTAQYQLLKKDEFWMSCFADVRLMSYTSDQANHKQYEKDWPYNIGDIMCPIWCFYGERDAIYPKARTDKLCAAILSYERGNKCQKEMVKGCAHPLLFTPNDKTKEELMRAKAFIDTEWMNNSSGAFSAAGRQKVE